MKTARVLLAKNVPLALLLLLPCLVIIYLAEGMGPLPIVLVLGLVIITGLVLLSYYKPETNFPILVALGFLMPLSIRMFKLYGLPVSMINEILLVVMILTLLFNHKLDGLKTFTGWLLLGWFIFQLLEIMNPFAESRVASLAGFRTTIPLFIGYFIMYSSINSKKDVQLYFIVLCVLGLLSGLYTLNQEFAGLPSFDYAYATSDERLYNLLFTWGRMRKFSFFFSPTEYGIIAAIFGVTLLSAFFFAKKISIKIFYLISGLICFWAMLYTGSRTAMVLIPVGLFFLVLITFNRYIIAAAVIIAMLGVVAVMKPGGNAALFVMSTAFAGKSDPSMNVRLVNQALIRSYIHEKPIGFGLGSTGYLGKKYSPHTFVGSFPPDSEYVKLAIETGWLGLLLWLLFMAFCFAYSVKVYFRVRDPEWRGLLTIAMVVQLMFIVAFYPQEMLNSFVITLVFIGMIAIPAKIDKLAGQKKENLLNNDSNSEMETGSDITSVTYYN